MGLTKILAIDRTRAFKDDEIGTRGSYYGNSKSKHSDREWESVTVDWIKNTFENPNFHYGEGGWVSATYYDIDVSRDELFASVGVEDTGYLLS